jgi:hypothetical protein
MLYIKVKSSYEIGQSHMQKQVADVLGFLMFVDILVTNCKKIDKLRIWKHC